MTAIQHYNNQLLFNLDVAAMPTNMAVKFHQPEPIVIEKFGGNNGCTFNNISHSKPQALQLSNVSQERLSFAVQLAKRDLKKQRQEESIHASQIKEKKAKGRTKIEHSAGYLEHVKRRQARVKGPMKIVERAKGTDHRTTAAQTRAKTADPNNSIAFVRHQKPMPAMSMSPPTRDGNIAGDTNEDKVQREISRLRQEMVDCMKTIQQMELHARKDVSQHPKKQYAEDVEAERKRNMRADEQATRSARTIYQLTQQVRDIQNDIDKLGPAPIKHTKKSQAMAKLAAAHRGAVRSIQTFIHHLPDYDLHKGLPQAYHDLTMLLRQLSLCCAQLEVSGQTGIPDSVLCLLQDYKAQISSSPPRGEQQSAQIKAKVNRSPASRKLEFGDPQPSKTAVVKETVVQPPKLSDKVFARAAVDATPDRQSALRAGIQALVRAVDSPRSPQRHTHKSPVPPLNLPVTPRTPRNRQPGGMTWVVPTEPKSRGLLLPSKLQSKRQRVHKAAPARPRTSSPDLGYAEPTCSSRLKEVQFPPDVGPISHSPRSTRTPRSQSNSPRRGRSGSPYGSPVSSARQAVNQQVMADRQSLNKGVTQSYPHDRLDSVVAGAEERIRQKLKPLLSQAQTICDQYEQVIGHNRHSLRHRLSQKAIEKVEMNADALADMLLQDVVTDTASELHQLRQESDANDEAAAMQDAPSLETMVQRMHDMEIEQEEIRRRWATIVYEDDDSGVQKRARYFDVGNSNQPPTPPPIEVTSMRSQGQQSQELRVSQLGSTSPILFTKPNIQTTSKETLHFNNPYAPEGAQSQESASVYKKIPLFLTNQMVNNIQTHKADFESYLKKTSHQTVGRFNPWQIVEEVADEIMDQCLLDVAKDLEEINNDVANHVYEIEFGGGAPPPKPQQFDDVTSTTPRVEPVIREVVFGTDSNYPIVNAKAKDTAVPHASFSPPEDNETSEKVISKTEPSATYNGDSYSHDYETDDSLEES